MCRYALMRQTQLYHSHWRRKVSKWWGQINFEPIFRYLQDCDRLRRKAQSLSGYQMSGYQISSELWQALKIDSKFTWPHHFVTFLRQWPFPRLKVHFHSYFAKTCNFPMTFDVTVVWWPFPRNRKKVHSLNILLNFRAQPIIRAHTNNQISFAARNLIIFVCSDDGLCPKVKQYIQTVYFFTISRKRSSDYCDIKLL